MDPFFTIRGQFKLVKTFASPLILRQYNPNRMKTPTITYKSQTSTNLDRKTGRKKDKVKIINPKKICLNPADKTKMVKRANPKIPSNELLIKEKRVKFLIVFITKSEKKTKIAARITIKRIDL